MRTRDMYLVTCTSINVLGTSVYMYLVLRGAHPPLKEGACTINTSSNSSSRRRRSSSNSSISNNSNSSNSSSSSSSSNNIADVVIVKLITL